MKRGSGAIQPNAKPSSSTKRTPPTSPTVPGGRLRQRLGRLGPATTPPDLDDLARSRRDSARSVRVPFLQASSGGTAMSAASHATHSALSPFVFQNGYSTGCTLATPRPGSRSSSSGCIWPRSTTWQIPPCSSRWPKRRKRAAGMACFCGITLLYRPPVRAVADPWIVFLTIAARTQRMARSARHPLSRRRVQKVARETATLDQLSHGRLVLGSDSAAATTASSNPSARSPIRASAPARLDEGLTRLGEPGQASSNPGPSRRRNPGLGRRPLAPPPPPPPRRPLGRDLPGRASRPGSARRARK